MTTYRIAIDPYPKRVFVSYKGTRLADTHNALKVVESAHQPVLYIPVKDVEMNLLSRSRHKTHCPFKGDATYWDLALPGEVVKNLVWGYEEPFDEVSDIRGHVAFYGNRVDIER